MCFRYSLSFFLLCLSFSVVFSSQGGLERLGSWQEEGHGRLCGPGARCLTERAFSVIRAILLFSPPPVLQERVLEFYRRTFSVHMSQSGVAVVAVEPKLGGLCPGCDAVHRLCWCQEALHQLQELSHILWVKEETFWWHHNCLDNINNIIITLVVSAFDNTVNSYNWFA